mmetsp:Transcript_18008/g.52638  ORF Transcript_18008/g.52638 Transcript_18008/m.52638 type:complete len:201 (+) Transcript_18008:358-960(+)
MYLWRRGLACMYESFWHESKPPKHPDEPMHLSRRSWNKRLGIAMSMSETQLYARQGPTSHMNGYTIRGRPRLKLRSLELAPPASSSSVSLYSASLGTRVLSRFTMFLTAQASSSLSTRPDVCHLPRIVFKGSFRAGGSTPWICSGCQTRSGRERITKPLFNAPRLSSARAAAWRSFAPAQLVFQGSPVTSSNAMVTRCGA